MEQFSLSRSNSIGSWDEVALQGGSDDGNVIDNGSGNATGVNAGVAVLGLSGMDMGNGIDNGIGVAMDTFDSFTGSIVHQSQTCIIYRLGDRGMKVLADTNRPIEEQLQRLSHELYVSKYLPSSCRRREALTFLYHNGRPALSFKWVHGSTLQTWLEKVRLRPTVDLNVRLRAAMAIAKTLADFHQGGVVHNGIHLENIVLDTREGDYVATFIDLSDAIILRGFNQVQEDPAVVKNLKDNDLKALGGVLDNLFTHQDRNPPEQYFYMPGERRVSTASDVFSEHEEDLWGEASRGKRGKQQTAGSSSVGEGLPLHLKSLVLTLLQAGGNSLSGTECYQSARDVYLDLKAIVENPNKCLQKCSWDAPALASQLELPDGFYGRQIQMTLLMHLFNSAVSVGNQPVMATICGCPGTGKSSLVNQIKGPLKEKQGFFVEGKFSKSHRPDLVLSSALDSFFGRLLVECSSQDPRIVSMRWRIHDAIGSSADTRFLEGIPNLKQFMYGIDSSAQSNPRTLSVGGGMMSSDRCKFMFTKVLAAISCRSHPLILFLDDIQWADEMTLDVMRMIMNEPDIHHFLLLGAFRENEVNPSHLLSTKLNDLKRQGIQVHTIKIGKMEIENVGALISDALYTPPSLCRSLASVIHSKTSGVILFVLKFLKSLNEEGLLWFNMTERRWNFDMKKISMKEISNDVVQHMSSQMALLPPQTRMGLKIAACIGNTFDANVLLKARRNGEFHMESFLVACVDGGFLRREGSSNKYIWAHDQIQQAALELIPISKRESFRLLIGSRLLLRARPSELKSDLLFCIVDNMNYGLHIMTNVDQKYEVATLNLNAGERSISSSAFHSATKYIMNGISLLGEDCFEKKYDLTMKLYDAASEALFVTGEFSRLSEVIEAPLLRAECFEDKLNIYHNLIRSLIAGGKYEECFSKCVSVLAQLGEYLPTEITEETYKEEAQAMKQLMRGKSQQKLLSLPIMSNFKKLAAMQFLNHALTLTYIWKPQLSPFIVFRMVKLTMRYGVCNLSAFAFGAYGAWLVSIPSPDFEGGYKMGRVATEVMHRLGSVEITSRLYVVVYTFINIWKEPMQASLSKHVEGYDVGISSGDTEYAISNLLQYVQLAFYGCGERLDGLTQTVEAYAKRAIQCNQAIMGKFILVTLQLVLELRGINQNVYGFFFEGNTEDSIFSSAQEKNDVQLGRVLCNKKKYKAFFLGDMAVAAEMYELYQKIPFGSNANGIPHIVGKFIDGLIAFYFARKRDDDEKKWTKIGVATMKVVRQWSNKSSWNFMNKSLLLEAEHAFLKGNDVDAMFSYNASIKEAREHRLIHEEGLAHEKCATFLLHKSRHDEALSYFLNAKRCYSLWGANSLVKRAQEAIEILLPLCGRP